MELHEKKTQGALMSVGRVADTFDGKFMLRVRTGDGIGWQETMAIQKSPRKATVFYIKS